MFPARLAIAKATDDASPAAGGTCQTFNATLKLFAPAALGSSSVALNEITSQTFEVTHVGSNAISAGEEVIVGQTIDERWIVLPSAPGSGSQARFQFATEQRIVNRQVQVKVLRNPTNAPNLVSGGILQPGDTVTINDPFNLWADIMPNATGWAYLASAQEDDPSTTNDEEHVARYEIEECSLTTNEVKGLVKECLFSETNEIEVIVNFEDEDLVEPQNLISAYPNVDEIPEVEEVTPSEGPSYSKITAYNPNNLDAVQGTFVTLQRVTNRQFSDPENYLCPTSRSSTQERWNIVQVEKKFARVIRVIYQGGDWVYNNYRADGFLPEDGLTVEPFVQCQIGIEAQGEWACDPIDGTIGWAIYKGQLSPAYQLVTTDKDLRGDPPERVSFVTNAWMAGCDLAVTKETGKVFCKTGLTVERSSINPEEKVVVTAGALSITDQCGNCSSVVIEKITNILLVWNEATGTWDLGQGETCDGNYTAPGIPGEDDPKEAIVQCATKEWKDTGHCGSTSAGSCSCDRSGRPDASTQSLGTPWIGTCTPSAGEANIQLCWTYETETIYTLPCPGAPVTGGDSSCIPLTDCPEDEEAP